ncbi:imidazole glycerol phosphate synthase subunit HisH [Sphingomonas sp. LY160]|uniref:imidazole glycerol phosphate synthase subunit HisH n=1 Tax=Sphingomonas sp. LY160 TaxID=3095342 RepID=UPI002ADEBF37|nr:imidazole glycerol phosphate synthase subunit HisH [Sphingomonas sp. LY160]MEA1070967.1 imidazole glycerol phosphate synthase subunit HisH [Sphingomonas sp. LY160]
MSDVVVLDLGYGNTRSIALAFERLGATVSLSADPRVAEQADRLVLPGVGAAGAAMRALAGNGIADALRARQFPSLGICLGMQLLFDRSDEDNGTALLGVVPGNVTAIPAKPGFPVPHMGWSRLSAETESGLNEGDYVYFAHSFVCPDGPATTARASYGETVVPAAIRSGPWWGAQFHPERSSEAGARFLKAFLSA